MQSASVQWHIRRKILLLCLALALLTIAVYWPVSENQFVAFDDQVYVTENPNVLAGVSWQGVYRAFSSFDAANWHPVTWLSHQADVSLFGVRPAPHHLTNLLLHTINTLLLFSLLLRLTGALWRSAIVAALFAVHPLHVESVAWVAERKDLLCAFFSFLTLHFYLRYTRFRRQWSDMLPVLFFFAMSLMSKPMSVTLPFLLLLLDRWPLQRIGTVSFRQLLREKLPLMVLSGISCIVTIYVQKAGDAVIALERLSLPGRICTALSSYMLYLWQMFLPRNLAILYPLPETPPYLLAAFGAVVIILVTSVAFRQRNTKPYLLVGWLWYLGMLVPVIGLVQVGVQSHADRYTYLPLIGCFVAIVWGLHDISARWSYSTRLWGTLTAAVLLIFAFQTRQQIYTWRNSETLFRHALSVTSNNYVMHTNLGITLLDSNRQEEAIKEFRKGIAICPKYAEQHFMLGNVLLVRGEAKEAAAEYATVLGLQPGYPFVHTNLGMALQRMGRIDEAVSEYRKGLLSEPDDYKASENLRILLRDK